MISLAGGLVRITELVEKLELSTAGANAVDETRVLFVMAFSLVLTSGIFTRLYNRNTFYSAKTM